MGRLSGKVAVITGAGSGMGAEQARLFAKEGAKVVGADMNIEGLQSVMDEIKAAGGEAIAVKLNISSPEEWENTIQTAVDTYGKVNVLVNTAGVAGPFVAKAAEHDVDEWDKLIGINLKGAFLGSKYAIPEMIKTGGGSIVTISSIGGLIGGQGGTGYGAAKAGLIGMTRNIAVDYGKDNVRANVICPGQIRTPMSAVLETDEAKEAKQYYLNKTPLGHFGDPIDIAYTALFLASEESKFITGTEIIVDGGVMAN
ncbi:short-chain dehydrogenase [Paenibacillus taichungensis]|uniref:Short-chain dehydrogenase n=1 Tax=Paenibacillus taichungensis TaxID=484184 RepID=A0A329QWT6_9BACL|nr:SDR family NAD(P)-dependent oxidoreductase [Paenibacillus taichungensis]RAW16159.1 short-chain dehydrogenase [Paenibacillus taichungensis]